ncbi:efflux RND transporter permease subunit [Phaeodactylibacter luteus]|uniref:Efflux RND transporter permease subunit n=1 Tax=Phaeodactylibacter luteus TaxID=1564516 RepID=A0A5C6S0P5_9BACT|nr:efflux RND transporter permease subunit [Phaeodactylibacter luteus]TXB67933.1 efflux RND transporter permease subunit [Phaeodactylibacter luteus]
MSLSSISIRRPVLASVFSIVIILFGLIGLTYLGIREYPSVDPPIITISTNYVGANADIIESQITEPIEEAVNGIAGIRSITSVSRDGRSTLTVEFDLEIDLETAANDVRDKVSQVVRSLPADTDPPIVSKADADSDPIIFLNIRSDQRSLLELTDIAENVFKERLQTIKGVSEIRIWGSKRYAMRMWIDPDRLAAYGLTPLDVQQALERENIELPSGSVEGATTELTVRTQGRLTSAVEFNDLIIREEGGRLVRFRDIGYAELGPENLRTVLKRDAVPMVGNAIVPQPGANNIEIADEFYRRLEQIKKDLPEDIKLGIGFDKTQFIRDSIDEVEQTIYVAFGLVVMIIFLFLRDWRTTLVPVVVIPIALVGAFFIMYAANFSINVLTLLGVVLAIGLVVDDAVVVLENIYAKIESGMTLLQAALKGSEEIFFAVIATTVALVAVFMPVIFLQGLTGRLFREFGIVIAGAVVISSFVALTLTPMLASKILKKRERPLWFYRVTEPFFVGLTKGYRSTLNGFMRFRWLAVVVMGISGWAIYSIGGGLPQELAPLEDRGRIRAFARAPEGATFEYMDAYMNELVRVMMKEAPESEGVISVTSPGFGASTSVNSGFAFSVLSPAGERERGQQEILNAMQPEVSKLTGAVTYLSQEQSIGNRRGGLPVQYVLQAPNFESLKENLPRFVEAVRQDPTFSIVDVDLKFNKPELNIEINRQKARDLGVSVLDIARTLQLGLSGQRFGYFIKDGKQYQVIGQIQRSGRDEPVDLRSLYVRNERGEMIQMDNLVSFREQTTPPTLYRFNRFASATVSAGLAGDKTIGDGIEAMDQIAAEVLDSGFYTTLTGTSRDFAESSSSLLFAFGLALLLIYLVLAAQFESFVDPFIIMFTVPLAIAGAVLSLMMYGQTLNIFSQIGIIMLIGLVAKNGILIVEFANQRKEAGLSRMEAIKEAAEARFRPILMTSLSTILGVLPIALALGAGSESRVSMGIAVIGGLVFATVLTLYVIPAIYSYLSSKESNRIKREQAILEAEEEASAAS